MTAVVLFAALIVAVLPASESVPEAVELLRQAAVKAGCERPVVSMRSSDGRWIEIEVSCKESP